MLGRAAVGTAALATAVVGGAALVRQVLATRRQIAHESQTEEEFAKASTRVLILGGGFGGISAALELEHRLDGQRARDTSVLVIDRDISMLFTPLLWPVASGAANPNSVVVPIRGFQRNRRFHVLHAWVNRIDLENKIVYADGAEPRPYDFLVIALGSVTQVPDLPGLRERALLFASPADALTLRNRLIDAIELAHRSDTPEERRAALTFVVGGGGDTGVELAATIHDYLDSGLLMQYPWLGKEPFRVVVVGRADRLVPTATTEMSEAIRRSLEEKGIEVRTGTAIQSVSETEVRTSNGVIPARTIFWAAGITAPRVVRDIPGIEHARNGSLIVDDHMRLPSHPQVYAIGDSSWGYDAETGEPLPPTAQAAEQQGAYVARCIVAQLQGRDMPPYSFSPRGHLVLLGRGAGVAQLGPVTLSARPPFLIVGRQKGLRVGPFQVTGLPAWLLWHGYYLSHIPRWRNRIYLLVDWTLTALTGRETAQMPLMAGTRE